MSQNDLEGKNGLMDLYPFHQGFAKKDIGFVDPSLVVGRSLLVSDEEMRVWIKALRHHLGWKLERMAIACGLKKQSLKNLEQTGRPSGPTLRVLDRLAQDVGFPVHSTMTVRPINGVDGKEV
uniref:Putative DNA binding, helix-turn-helix domain containing protein n=1 Tax=viral metagenome TaxID=1070528 RepID=A0A6M3KYC4_9ZZZZ